MIDRNCTLASWGVCVHGGAGGAIAPQDFGTDQLTPSQPGGREDYAHQIILAPSDFQTFLQTCSIVPINKFFIMSTEFDKIISD